MDEIVQDSHMINNYIANNNDTPNLYNCIYHQKLKIFEKNKNG